MKGMRMRTTMRTIATNYEYEEEDGGEEGEEDMENINVENMDVD
jgi:hypothetical protein